MQKVKITKIFTKQETSQRTGKPYTRMSIKCNEYGDRWVSGFQGKENAHWKEGDEVEVIIEKKVQGDKEYLNFSVPKMEAKVAEGMDKVLSLLTGINLRVIAIHEHVMPKNNTARVGAVPMSEGIEYPEEDINPEDIPF